jgi:hypothetical protein
MNDESDLSESSSESSKFIVDPMNGTERSINQGLYSKAFSYTKHYNITKIKHKIALLGWMAATLIAFSYILSGKEIGTSVDKLISIALIAIFSSRGVLLLLLLDTKIYHRLLNSSFLAGLEMEKEGICKAHIHKNMMKALLPEALSEAQKKESPMNIASSSKIRNVIHWIFTGEKGKGLDPVFYDGLYYCSCCFCLWIIASISISSYIYHLNYKVTSFIFCVVSVIISFLICVHIMRKTIRSGINKFKNK